MRTVLAILAISLTAAGLTGCGSNGATPKETVTAPAKAKPKPKRVSAIMPRLIGKNGATASDTLTRLGITNVDMGSSDPNASVVLLPANWRVVKQEPRAGARVRTGDGGTLVVLTLTKQS